MIPTFESHEMSKIFCEKHAKIAVITKHGGISDWSHSSVSFLQLLGQIFNIFQACGIVITFQVYFKNRIRKTFLIVAFLYEHMSGP